MQKLQQIVFCSCFCHHQFQWRK